MFICNAQIQLVQNEQIQRFNAAVEDDQDADTLDQARKCRDDFGQNSVQIHHIPPLRNSDNPAGQLIICPASFFASLLRPGSGRSGAQARMG